MKNSVVLIILDGWGIGRKDYSNPIHVAKPKNIRYIKENYAMGALQASGIAVGLPWGEEGNSEVGHLTIGAGKTIYQHYPRITLQIRNGGFLKNQVLLDAGEHVKKSNSALHLVGLLSQDNIYSSLEHIEALLVFAKQNNIKKLALHLFSDGKDSPPKSVEKLLKKVEGFIQDQEVGTITSISGRFYAMDRDEHWDRTQKVYNTLLGENKVIENRAEKINSYYLKTLGDEFIEPFRIADMPIQDNDAVFFFNFREDASRQIASPFIIKGFDKFQLKPLTNIFIATMTEYAKNFKVPVAFPNEIIEEPLGKILADNDKLQLRIAETEKYAHITYFFNAYKERAYKNEYRILIPSQNVASPDEIPGMMAPEITTRLLEAIEEEQFDFILVNYANADMVAHTGNYDASLKAISILDEEIGKILQACQKHKTSLIITADHGNLERIINPLTGMIETGHDPSLVPIYLVDERYVRQKQQAQIDAIESEAIGILADITPTILELISIPKPDTMNGQSLLSNLR
jgi:2,3-bisphosphoglycerate-independent phosphoglycerate mutase